MDFLFTSGRAVQKFIVLIAAVLCLSLFAQCRAENVDAVKEHNTMKITLPGGTVFFADFADNSSAESLKEVLRQGPLAVRMSDYGGFEKVGDLNVSLVRNDRYMHTKEGDIILYQGRYIVIYYAENNWSLTSIGKIRNTEGLRKALGDGDVTVIFSLEQGE